MYEAQIYAKHWWDRLTASDIDTPSLAAKIFALGQLAGDDSKSFVLTYICTIAFGGHGLLITFSYGTGGFLTDVRNSGLSVAIYKSGYSVNGRWENVTGIDYIPEAY